MSTRKKAYLAGPDVFLPESIEVGERLKSLCLQHGMDGLYPLDNQMPKLETVEDAAHWISAANIDLIRQADYVIANLNPFRGFEPDSGTCVEVGIAIALNKPVFAYFSDHRPMADKVPTDANNLDTQGMYVENFNLPLNLMLACNLVSMHTSAHEAISAASAFK
jgi:nucleoside 2-deoxyribosyltransferase